MEMNGPSLTSGHAGRWRLRRKAVYTLLHTLDIACNFSIFSLRSLRNTPSNDMNPCCRHCSSVCSLDRKAVDKAASQTLQSDGCQQMAVKFQAVQPLLCATPCLHRDDPFPHCGKLDAWQPTATKRILTTVIGLSQSVGQTTPLLSNFMPHNATTTTTTAHCSVLDKDAADMAAPSPRSFASLSRIEVCNHENITNTNVLLRGRSQRHLIPPGVMLLCQYF